MLAIRMQRTGRRGHAMFRVVVQDSRRTPTSGKVVARLGSYDPHAKSTVLDKSKATYYLEHGAQPSDRVARLLKGEGVQLPAWVKLSESKKRTVRNAEKRRSTRPAGTAAPEPAAQAEVAEESAETEKNESAAPKPTEKTDKTEQPAEIQPPEETVADSEDTKDS
ncbi:MAG TPA: 30S ribosomal protein S16 [Candidatus Saccharimonadales bacterium]|nr:30S ribosomal protein S16 [Candidatus Saccharimonadales bacterium]